MEIGHAVAFSNCTGMSVYSLHAQRTGIISACFAEIRGIIHRKACYSPHDLRRIGVLIAAKAAILRKAAYSPQNLPRIGILISASASIRRKTCTES
jgi:hypothetical protein